MRLSERERRVAFSFYRKHTFNILCFFKVQMRAGQSVKPCTVTDKRMETQSGRDYSHKHINDRPRLLCCQDSPRPGREGDQCIESKTFRD